MEVCQLGSHEHTSEAKDRPRSPGTVLFVSNALASFPIGPAASYHVMSVTGDGCVQLIDLQI